MKLGYLAAALLAAWFADRLLTEGRYTDATVRAAVAISHVDWRWSS